MVMTVLVVTTPEQMREALRIRRRVFIQEQGVTEAEEIDLFDGPPKMFDEALHVLGRVGSEAVATGRILLEPTEDHHVTAGRVAVLESWRGCGYGREIMLALQTAAQNRGFFGVTLAAQSKAEGFYEGLGYQSYGDVFLDANIDHRWMKLVF